MNTAYFLQSDTADDLTWSRYASPTFDKDTQIRSALSRIKFTDLSNTLPLHTLVQRARQLREVHRRVLIVTGRSKRFIREGFGHELKQLMEEQRCTGHESELVRNTIGDVGAAFVIGASTVSGVIVVQAMENSLVGV